MIWLVAFSLSPTHGSEAAVGWQWYVRLNAVAPVTVIAHQVYDGLGWVPDPLRSQVRWIDTVPTAVADVNQRRHLFAFWRQARALLRREARPGDRVVIVTQAAIWFLPWGRLPVPRRHVFYGPIGPELLRGDPTFGLGGRTRLVLRNAATAAFALLWRAGAPWLPGRISLRFPAPWIARAMGPRYCFDAVLPEVEPPAGTPAAVPPPAPPPGVGLLYDDRPRKNFAGSFAYALDLAARRGVPLALVGVPASAQLPLAARAAAAGARLEFRPRAERAAFRSWLAEGPALVALSLSEGVPSTLYEALVAGCELHVYDVGGIAWLLRHAETVTPVDYGGRHVIVFRWTAASAAGFATASRSAFNSLVEVILTD